MRKKLNEDMLVVKASDPRVIVPEAKKIVSEDLGDFYSSEVSEDNLYDAPMKELTTAGLELSSGTDKDTITIKQGDKSVTVASDKFVLVTRNHLAAIITDLQTLKKAVTMSERTISQLKSKVESLNGLKSEVSKLKNRTPSDMFKDGK